MKQKVRVVFDTNIYLSAILFGGNPRQCLELARSGQIELFVSKAILLEISRNLQNKFHWKAEEIEEVIKGIDEFAILISAQTTIRVIKTHSQDNRILEAAQEADVDYNISIISTKQFLDIFYES